MLSYCEGAELKELLADLGEELLTKKKEVNSAIVCLIIGKSIEQVFDLWKKRALFLMKKGMDRNEALYLLFEKYILLKTVCNNKTSMVDFDLIVHDMADFMSNANLKQLAMKYLDLSNPKQANVAILRERVFTSDSSR